MPKCVKRIGHGAATSLILALGKLNHEHCFTRSSCVRKLLSDGPNGVMLCHNDFANEYPSPEEPVCAYAFHHVVMTT
ncbi:MAG: hypothetical protein WCJ81_04815 [bacterium]